MSYTTIFGSYIDENDSELERKFGYQYRVLRGVYPDAYKLPENEVRNAIGVFFEGDADEGVEKMVARVKDYTTAKEPEWKVKYFGEKPKPQPQESYSSTTIKAPSSFAQTGGNQDSNAQKYISEDDEFYDLKHYLTNKEKKYNHMYLGKVGDLTHCIGHYDESEEETLTHPWVYKTTGLPASREDIIKNRNKILSAPRNYNADWYDKHTDIELSDEYCYQLLDSDIKIRDRELLRGIPNYSKMDNNMRQGLLEPHFTSNILPWRRLRDAATVKNKDWVCSELHRNETDRPDLIDRNKWSYDKCMQGKFIK